MDKKDWISAILLSILVMATWMGYQYWYVRHHPPEPSAQVEPSATQPSATSPSTTQATTAPGAVASTNPATQGSGVDINGGASMTAGMHAIPTTRPTVASLGSDVKNDATYAMRLEVAPAGAGIGQVLINSFPSASSEQLKSDEKQPYVCESPIPGHADSAALASRSVVIDGIAVDLSTVDWEKTSSDATSATYSVQIADADGPLAQITKTYRISPRDAADGNKGYEVAVEQNVRCLRAGRTLKVHAVLNGPTPVPPEVDPPVDQAVIAGYAGAANSISVAQYPFSEYKPDSSSHDLTTKDEKQVAWFGQMSTYFAALVLPEQSAGKVTVHSTALAPEGQYDRGVQITFDTPETTAAFGQETSVARLSVYLGPKWRAVLGSAHYADFPRGYEQILVIRSGLCALCTIPQLIYALVAVLRLFHFLTRDWGLAIICLVLCVRALLHPITKRSQVQMMKMSKLSPEVEKLKKKYADQPDQLNKEMMKLYKEQSGALLGCLPMFLQAPIWIALWAALQSTFELRQAPFLFGLTWINDLARPDTLIDIQKHLGHPLQLIFGFQLRAINILPLLMACVTYINMRYFTPMPPAATPEQEQQQKIQRGMSVIFPLMFYGLPSGLNIYYLTTTTLGIIESKIIRNHIKEREEAEKAGRVIVPTKATRASRRKDDAAADPPAKTSGLMARMMQMMEEAQKRAEEIRRENQKKEKGK